MVRINLIKQKLVTGSPRPAKSTGVRILIICLITLITGIAAIVGLRGWKNFIGVKETSRIKPSDSAPQSPFKPSTYATKANIIEDVVKEISDERASGANNRTLYLPYTELSPLEKINYEVLFAKNIFSIFSKAVPSGIGLKSLEIENFQSLYAVGLGSTKELVTATFTALKSEKFELLPQPYSYITSNNGDGYRFVVTVKPQFGLDLTDPFQASDHLPVRDDLPVLTKKIITLAAESGVTLKNRQEQLDAEKIGAYRRFHYRYQGTSTYNDFIKFLLNLYSNRVPCAFKKVEMKALSGTSIEIETQVIFTVRE